MGKYEVNILSLEETSQADALHLGHRSPSPPVQLELFIRGFTGFCKFCYFSTFIRQRGELVQVCELWERDIASQE